MWYRLDCGIGQWQQAHEVRDRPERRLGLTAALLVFSHFVPSAFGISFACVLPLSSFGSTYSSTVHDTTATDYEYNRSSVPVKATAEHAPPPPPPAAAIAILPPATSEPQRPRFVPLSSFFIHHLSMPPSSQRQRVSWARCSVTTPKTQRWASRATSNSCASTDRAW